MKIHKAAREVDGHRLITVLRIKAETLDEARVLTEFTRTVEENGIELQKHLADTLAVVRRLGECPVQTVANELKLESATAANNRMATLFKRGFLKRRSACVASGGSHYLYSATADEEINTA